MLMQKNIRISKEILAEQLSISVSTIKREMKALGYEWWGTLPMATGKNR